MEWEVVCLNQGYNYLEADSFETEIEARLYLEKLKEKGIPAILIHGVSF